MGGFGQWEKNKEMLKFIFKFFVKCQKGGNVCFEKYIYIRFCFK